MRRMLFVRRILLTAAAIFLLASISSARLRHGREVLTSLSWGDQITLAPEAKEPPDGQRRKGAEVLWRV